MSEGRTESALTMSGGGAELVEELRATLERAAALLHVLESSMHRTASPDVALPADERARELERQLKAAESDLDSLASQLAVTERQASRLLNLYVATYQLYATLRPAEVQATIAEIAVNLLGAEKFVLLLRDEGEASYTVALAGGQTPEAGQPFGGDVYCGGDPMVDAPLLDGVLRLGPAEGSSAIAAVPLKVQGEVVGAIVLLKLFEHKPSLRTEDRELLDLLSAHAASALFAAQAFATKDRKLQTLESLLRLARGR